MKLISLFANYSVYIARKPRREALLGLRVLVLPPVAGGQPTGRRPALLPSEPPGNVRRLLPTAAHLLGGPGQGDGVLLRGRHEEQHSQEHLPYLRRAGVGGGHGHAGGGKTGLAVRGRPARQPVEGGEPAGHAGAVAGAEGQRGGGGGARQAALPLHSHAL